MGVLRVMLETHWNILRVLLHILCLRVFCCIIGYIQSTLRYIGTTLENIESTLEHIGSTFGYFDLLGV